MLYQLCGAFKVLLKVKVHSHLLSGVTALSSVLRPCPFPRFLRTSNAFFLLFQVITTSHSPFLVTVGHHHLLIPVKDLITMEMALASPGYLFSFLQGLLILGKLTFT